MSLKKIHDKQPDKFEFTETNQNLADKILKKYPPDQKKSAVMPLLYLAQNQNENWIPLAAMKYIGKFLNMPYINVKVAGKLTQKQRKEIVSDITNTMLKVAGKPASSTYVQIDEVPRNQWGVGGKMLSEK